MQNGHQHTKSDCWGSLPMWLMGLTLILSVYAQANTVRCQLGPVKLSMQENLIHEYHCTSATTYRSMLLLLFLLQLPKRKAETGWLWQWPNPNSSHQSTMADCFIWSCFLKQLLVSEVKSLSFLPAWGICLEIPITEQDCLPFVCSMDGWHQALGLHQNKSPICVYDLARDCDQSLCHSLFPFKARLTLISPLKFSFSVL